MSVDSAKKNKLFSTDTSANNQANNTIVSDICLSSLLMKDNNNLFLSLVLKIFSPVLERLLGINKLRKLYLDNNLSGLDKLTFSKTLLAVLGVQVIGEKNITDQLPETGACIVVCNHPYGMVEGVIIAQLLSQFRRDTKVMANVGLKIFKELNDYFIFANPLKPKSAINTSAIKQCFTHLNHNGLLVIFPAGRVSFFQPDKQRIADGDWNRLAVQLANKTGAPILPVFISGTNSKVFHCLGRLYYRFRLTMLIREMFKLSDKAITLSCGNLLKNKQLSTFDKHEDKNVFTRLQCYLNDQHYIKAWSKDNVVTLFEPLIATADTIAVNKELSALPEKQLLLTFKSFTVYYGYQHQLPLCVQEITRLRELTFRSLNEGSGQGCDTDHYDATYMHLFIYDNKDEEIIGAYRIGQTDLLQKRNGISGLYLSQMFNFNAEFINQQEPCLEMGRSFIVAKHQNSFHGLLLLWKGIGAFVCQNPHYRTLYGTVSLSKLYDPRSVALIEKVMVSQTSSVSAHASLEGLLHPEVIDFLANRTISTPLTIEQLSAFVTAIEVDGKDLPVLLKQYHKLGAKFHCIAIDTNFNQTPGLLLSVDLPKAPEKLLKLYLGNKRHEYLSYLNSEKNNLTTEFT